MKKSVMFLLTLVLAISLSGCGMVISKKVDTGDGTYQIQEYQSGVHTKTALYDKRGEKNAVWYYNAKNECVRAETYIAGKIISYTENIYDENGSIKSQTHYLAGGKMDYHTESLHDEIILMETYSNGSLERKSVYDRKDSVTYRTDTDRFSHILCKAVLTDAGGKETYYDKNGNALYVYKYNESGDLIGKFDLQGNRIGDE